MPNKIITYIKSLNIFQIFLGLFILGLLYGGMSLYTKYLGFTKFMNQTKFVNVKTVPVKIDIAKETYKAISIVESSDSIEITSKVNGLIDNIHFKEGTTVDKGSLLYSIISADKIGLTKIHAPFKGKIGLSNKNLGDTVIRGDFLTALDNYDTMKLSVDLPERLLPFLVEDLEYIASSDNLPGIFYTGKLSFVDTRINNETRTISAYSLLDNSKQEIKPGLLMKLDIFLKQVPNSILIPEESLLSINKKHFVYVVNNDLAQLKSVEIGIRNDAFIQIKNGLTKNDSVIYMGQEKLKDGSKIKIIE